MIQHLSEQQILRRNALQELRKLGIDPYPHNTYEVTHQSEDISIDFDNLEGKEVQMAGRIMSRRIMGKASFAEIQDERGRVQLYLNRDELCPTEDKTLYNTVFKKLLDIGDFIGVKGTVFKTQTGEPSIHVVQLNILSKSIHPLPIVKEKDGKLYDTFQDPEQRYRRRYVDLTVNTEVREIFKKRTKVIDTIRTFFNEQDYLEVETPVLQSIPGGATALPFETHHKALNIPLYLRIANELYLKRLIVGGFDGVYEFSRNFRNEGMSRFHNPEFTGLEIYVAYKDYNWMMSFTEQLIERVALATNNSTEVQVGTETISFKAPYRRVSMVDIIKEYTKIDISGKNEAELRAICDALEVVHTPEMGTGKLIDAIFGEKCEPHCIQPTFIIDYPVEMSPLCKRHRDNPQYTERFELMVNGKELCNAYTELNDPIDQLERFQEQQKLSKKGDDEAMFIDMDFIRALEYGMPPTAGMGMGIDRLVMMMTNQPSIQEVLFFPQMKPEPKETIDNKEAYTALGIPEEWVEHLQKMGYKRITTLVEQKPSKLFNELCGFNKKNKLQLTNPTLENVTEWLDRI